MIRFEKNRLQPLPKDVEDKRSAQNPAPTTEVKKSGAKATHGRPAVADDDDDRLV